MGQSDGNQPYTMGGWREFTAELCRELNSARCLVVAATSAEGASEICSRVDQACTNLCNTGDDTGMKFSLKELVNMTRVCFTSKEAVEKLQDCTAVYGRVPMVMLLEMGEDRSFVLDITAVTSIEDIAVFLSGVARGEVSKALQGAAPPPNDRFEPLEGVTLHHCLCAVTCTFERLMRQEPGGALCVFWSHRCTMCPGVMLLLDTCVGALRLELRRHGIQQSFTYMCCDVDENDLPEHVFPKVLEEQEVTVPQIVAYDSNGKRFAYEGRRTPALIVSFAWEHCVPEVVKDASDVWSSVVKAVESLCVEGLVVYNGPREGSDTNAGVRVVEEANEETKHRKRSRSPCSE